METKLKHYTFNSQVTEVGRLPDFTRTAVKNEPMLFNCDPGAAWDLGGELTRLFLLALPEKWRREPGLVIDSRVHMLMQGWYPCIPGFHHDDVPRTRSDGQPNYANPDYYAYHVMALVGDCCPTEFAVGKADFPEVPSGDKYYKVWHPLVKAKLAAGELARYAAPEKTLLHFNWQTWHQGTPAIKDGWRWFIRATMNTGRKPTNELRRQVQVYLDAPMEGW